MRCSNRKEEMCCEMCRILDENIATTSSENRIADNGERTRFILAKRKKELICFRDGSCNDLSTQRFYL